MLRPSVTKTILTFLLLTAALSKASGQYIYEFNKSGELVSGQPNEFKAHQTFNVQIAFDTVLFKSQLDSFLVNLSQSHVLWTNILHKLEKNTAAGLSDPRVTDWKISIRDMLMDQGDLYTGLANISMSQLLSRYGYGAGTSPRNWHYVPAPEVVIRHLEQQYRLRQNATGAPDCLLEPVLLPAACGWYFAMPGAVPVTEDLKLYLYRENGLRSLVIDWYMAHRQLFPDAALTLFENAVKADQAVFNRMKDFSTRMNIPKSEGACDTLNTTMQDLIDSVPLMDFTKALDSVDMAGLRTWLLDMTWLDKGGQVQMDPVPVTNGGLYRDIGQATPADTIDNIVMSKMAKLLSSDTLTRETSKDYLSIWYKRDSAKNRQDSVIATAKKKADANPAQTAAAALAAYGQTAQLLNIVQTPITQAGKPAIHIRQYYYNRRPDKRQFGYDYPEDEHVVLAVNNRPVAKGIVVVDQQTPYTEQPLVTEQSAQSLPGSSVAAPKPAGWPSVDGDIGKEFIDQLKISNFLNGVQEVMLFGEPNPQLGGGRTPNPNPGGYPKTTPKPTSPPVPQPPTCRENYGKLFAQLKAVFGPYRVWDSLYNASESPPLFLEQTANDSPQLVTDVIHPDGSQKPPYQYKYKITFQDTSKSLSLLNPLDSSGYRVGKRRLVELALGVAYAVSSVRQVNVGVDTATGNLQPSSTETKAQFVVGLKFHVKKIYWENNQFALSCKSLHDGTFWTRVSFFGGVSIPSPINNVYTGVGLDLVPGINVNCGSQWYNYNTYKVNNNQVIESRAGYRAAFYVALTADPTLVVNIVKTFF
jgi:hypothetical protein